MQDRIAFLIDRAQAQNPLVNIRKIRAAYECADAAHAGQKRRNG